MVLYIQVHKKLFMLDKQELKSAYSNVHKVLTGKLIYKPYGYNWKYIE